MSSHDSQSVKITEVQGQSVGDDWFKVSRPYGAMERLGGGLLDCIS